MAVAKKRLHVLLSLLLLAVVMTVLVSGCESDKVKPPGGIELSFEKLQYKMIRDKKYTTPEIHVIATKEPELPWHITQWLAPESQSEFISIDYSRYFILQVEIGQSGSAGYDIEIQKIWQKDHTVYIKAIGTGPTSGSYLPQVISSISDIVKVSKDKMTQFGEINFRLFYSSGYEIVAAAHVIPPGSDS